MAGVSPKVVDDPDYGRSAPALGWVPAPRYLLRRDVVLRRVRSLPRGDALEIGCGAGALVADLHAIGFRCEAMETSPEARALATQMLADLPGLRVRDSLAADWNGRFDLLIALEVLEHIEDDAAALREWVAMLKPRGRVLLSVPAHARKWSPTDVWAGHYRRYDRADFVALAERCGLVVQACENYGFPLANFTHGVKAVLARRELASQPQASEGARAHRTAESGVERGTEARVFPFMTTPPGRVFMRAAMRVQRRFAKTEMGNGFVLEALKPGP